MYLIEHYKNFWSTHNYLSDEIALPLSFVARLFISELRYQ